MDIGKALGGAQSFLFGPGTDTPTYESLRKKREIAEMLAQQSIGGEYRNWGDGVGGILKALGYRMMDKKLGPQEDAERARISDLLGGFGGGPSGPVAGAAGGFTGAGYSGDPETLSDGGSYRDAIASIESAGSGDYSALGPVTKTGDRAYGRYQVMGANIPDWTQQALGQQLSPEQFVSNPQAQDQVFDHVFGGYADQYGPEGAASKWFTGSPTPSGKRDQLGTSDNDYVAKFMSALGGGGLGGPQQQPDMGRISQLAEVMGNPYATDGQKMVAQALVERELAQQDPIDPLGMARLGLDAQRLQLDRDKFASGTREGPKYYGSVQWAERPGPETGEMVMAPYQVGTDGTVNWIDMGGAQPLPPTRNVDLGTSVGVQPTAGGAVTNMIPKDVRGAAAQAEVGKSAGAAAAGIGDKEVNVQAALDQIYRISNDPALDGILGNWEGRLPSRTQAQANVQAQVEGLQGKVFNAAIDSLRGLGAMTEREGDAAKQAMAALSQLQDGPAYRAELKRLGDLLKAKLDVARQKAATVGGVDKWLDRDTRDMTPEELDQLILDLQGQ